MSEASGTIDSREKLAARLRGKRNELSQAVAVRAALRVAPLAFSALGLTAGNGAIEREKRFILMTMRATFVSWVASHVFPTAIEVQKAASLAGDAAKAVGGSLGGRVTTNAILAAANAAFAAGNAASARAFSSPSCYRISLPMSAVAICESCWGLRMPGWMRTPRKLG